MSCREPCAGVAVPLLDRPARRQRSRADSGFGGKVGPRVRFHALRLVRFGCGRLRVKARIPVSGLCSGCRGDCERVLSDEADWDGLAGQAGPCYEYSIGSGLQIQSRDAVALLDVRL